jgi:hypothetical protein
MHVNVDLLSMQNLLLLFQWNYIVFMHVNVDVVSINEKKITVYRKLRTYGNLLLGMNKI